MANNISEITQALENLNTTFSYNATNILEQAIEQSNVSSDGWIRILVFGIFIFTIALFLIKNKLEFRLSTDVSLSLFTLLIATDIGFILYQYRIIQNLQPVMFIYTLFIVVCIFSLLKRSVKHSVIKNGGRNNNF